MTVDSALAPLRSIAARQLRVGTRTSLAGLVVASTAVRALVALAHSTPTYFPDEYIYSALSRSLASSGRPLVRGASAHFPALLEPLLAAPLWLVGSTETAYRLVQFENALLMSLAAVPTYLLARRLGLGSGYALACALFALAIPDLAFSPFLIADPIAYPLVLAALYAGVVALQDPGRRAQLAFIALAALATLTRVQFVVLVPAFLVAALALDRRASLRLHRLPLLILAGSAALLLALGPGRALGYYSAVAHLRLHRGFFRWAALDLLFLALSGGVALAPGAVVGLLSARERAERAFAALVVPFSLLVMAEAAVYASNGSDRFKERYLFVLLPLLPIAYGLYLRRGRPARLAVTVLASGIAAGAALVSLSGYVKGDGFDDSPLLWCYTELQWRLGSAGASLLFAACAIAAAAVAVAASWPRLRLAALAAALVLVASISVGAVSFDLAVSKQIRQQFVATNPAWVDAAHVGPVAAIETDLAPASALTEQLFWNRSIQHELLLGSSPAATDPLSTETLRVAADGELLLPALANGRAAGAQGEPLRGAFLFQGFEVSARFSAAKAVARYSSFTLLKPVGIPRLSTYELGRYWDGWLAPAGGLEVWPGSASAGELSFTLSLPRSAPRVVALRVAGVTYRVQPGRALAVRIPIHGSEPWSTRFTALGGSGALADGRAVSVRSTTPLFIPA